MSDTLHAAGVAFSLVAFVALSACDSGPANSAPLPNVAAVVPSTTPAPVAVATPASGVKLQGVTPGGTPGDGPSSHGAETSPGSSAGPGNGSTAVGGQAGGQATGGGMGGKPAPTAGDGAAQK